MRRFVLCLILAAVPTLAAHADLTLTARTEGTGLGSVGDGETVTYIQGLKLRSDQQDGKHTTSTILDLDKQEMVVLDSKKKRADVFDLTDLARQQAAIADTDVKVSLEATGNSRQILDRTCEEHQMRIQVTAAAQDQPMSLDVVLQGPVCLVADAPGREDYLNFYQTMAERGLFLGDPRAAQSQPGREKGMSALYRSMAEKGVAYASEMEVGFEGSGMMAKMMKRMGFTMSTTVTAVSTDPIDPAVFEIPAGYKVKRQ